MEAEVALDLGHCGVGWGRPRSSWISAPPRCLWQQSVGLRHRRPPHLARAGGLCPQTGNRQPPPRSCPPAPPSSACLTLSSSPSTTPWSIWEIYCSRVTSGSILIFAPSMLVFFFSFERQRGTEAPHPRGGHSSEARTAQERAGRKPPSQGFHVGHGASGGALSAVPDTSARFWVLGSRSVLPGLSRSGLSQAGGPSRGFLERITPWHRTR